MIVELRSYNGKVVKLFYACILLRHIRKNTKKLAIP